MNVYTFYLLTNIFVIMKKAIKIRFVGAENETILERIGVTPEVIVSSLQLLDDSSYLEISIVDSPAE